MPTGPGKFKTVSRNSCSSTKTNWTLCVYSSTLAVHLYPQWLYCTPWIKTPSSRSRTPTVYTFVHAVPWSGRKTSQQPARLSYAIKSARPLSPIYWQPSNILLEMIVRTGGLAENSREMSAFLRDLMHHNKKRPSVIVPTLKDSTVNVVYRCIALSGWGEEDAISRFGFAEECQETAGIFGGVGGEIGDGAARFTCRGTGIAVQCRLILRFEIFFVIFVFFVKFYYLKSKMWISLSVKYFTAIFYRFFVRLIDWLIDWFDSYEERFYRLELD